MSSMRDEFRRDSEKRPQDLEREIDETRAHMERTLDLLERKLSPGELIDELLTMVRRDGGGFARNLSTQVQNNPVPTLLTAVGLTWLMSASDRPPRRYPSDGRPGRYAQARDAAARSMHGAGEAVGHARERAGELGERAHEMGEHAREMASDAGHRMHEMADDARARMGDMAASLRRGSQRAGSEYEHLLHEQPLLLGGLGLALGAALGAMLPRTQAEDELMGGTSDRVKRDLEQEGERQYERARETAERAASAAGEQVSASGEGGTQQPR
jgi:ElaB/YqjD/DUF883 family membrane-anchored ribosome-binding protein